MAERDKIRFNNEMYALKKKKKGALVEISDFLFCSVSYLWPSGHGLVFWQILPAALFFYVVYLSESE